MKCLVNATETLYRERKAVLGVIGMGYVGLPLRLQLRQPDITLSAST